MTIAAMLRVKNEARWIGEVLTSLKRLTGDILVLDDNSTDGTAAICWQHGATVITSPFDTLDETRDKNFLLGIMRAKIEQPEVPDYVICIDGDEVLSESAPDAIRRHLRPGIAVLTLPVRYLWDDRQHYRADGVYGRYSRASMFALKGQPANVCFRSTSSGGNFHCGNVPANLQGSGATVSAAELLHLGYMDPADRLRKYHWYRERDPGNRSEDEYRHIAQGLLPEIPASAKLLHGGPLKIFSLGSGKWPSTEVNAPLPAK